MLFFYSTTSSLPAIVQFNVGWATRPNRFSCTVFNADSLFPRYYWQQFILICLVISIVAYFSLSQNPKSLSLSHYSRRNFDRPCVSTTLPKNATPTLSTSNTSLLPPRHFTSLLFVLLSHQWRSFDTAEVIPATRSFLSPLKYQPKRRNLSQHSRCNCHGCFDAQLASIRAAYHRTSNRHTKTIAVSVSLIFARHLQDYPKLKTSMSTFLQQSLQLHLSFLHISRFNHSPNHHSSHSSGRHLYCFGASFYLLGYVVTKLSYSTLQPHFLWPFRPFLCSLKNVRLLSTTTSPSHISTPPANWASPDL